LNADPAREVLIGLEFGFGPPDEEYNYTSSHQVTVHSEEEKQLIKQMRKEEKKLTKVSYEQKNVLFIVPFGNLAFSYSTISYLMCSSLFPLETLRFHTLQFLI